jgi:hypothetical protein
MREITDGRGVSEPGAFFARTLAVTVGPQNSGPDRLKSGYEAHLGACWRQPNYRIDKMYMYKRCLWY